MPSGVTQTCHPPTNPPSSKMKALKIEIRRHYYPTPPLPVYSTRKTRDVSGLMFEHAAPPPMPPRLHCRYIFGITPCWISFMVLFVLYLALCGAVWAWYKDHEMKHALLAGVSYHLPSI